MAGSLSAIKARAPVLGGNFGIWGGLFSSFDCAVKGYRQKEDPWNAIIAGFFTGGTLAARCESDVEDRDVLGGDDGLSMHSPLQRVPRLPSEEL